MLSALRVVSSADLRLLIFLPAILMPACASSSPAFPMMFSAYRASLVAQTVRNPPAMWETLVQPPGLEDPLEKEMAIHSSLLAWRNAMGRGAWRGSVHGVAKSRT